MEDQVKKLINFRIIESIGIKESMLKDQQLMKDIGQMADQCLRTVKSRGKILFCGNGGSAADAQHLAGELVGKFYKDRPPISAEALHVNTSYLTAVANDYSYDTVFSRQLEASAHPGDVLIGLSTSGNSINVVNAVKKANEIGVYTIGLTGNKKSKLKESANLCICVPSADTPRIQECHILIGHILCEYLEESLY